ncbi:hypothetical protein [Desulfomarina sp.]
MNGPADSAWDGTERRKKNRRQGNRRKSMERRCDTRENRRKQKKNLRTWVRSLTNSRLGVDRRKGKDQRTIHDQRNPSPRSMLTKEELADLLGK